MKKFTAFTLVLVIYTLSANAKYSDKLNQSGIDFIHDNGMKGEFYFPEIMGSGLAALDYDNDGDMDLLFIQSGSIEEIGTNSLDRLYRNDTTVSDQPKFTDVTREVGLNSMGYGMGAAVGDLNNDGYQDLFINNFGVNEIFMNENGNFKKLNVPEVQKNNYWSVSSSLIDYNNDGLLDIFVANYVNYKVSKDVKTCFSSDQSKDYCSPQAFTYQKNTIYKNLGNFQFKDITETSGIKTALAPSLGVIAADLNNDSKVDFYVANDGEPNNLWINLGKDKFKDKGFLSGLSVNMNGLTEASMGVDISDFDNDGDLDVFMTHLNRETNTLFVNNGRGMFSDQSIRAKLGASSFAYTGFGTMWIDYDLDGALDLFSANGEVITNKEQFNAGDPFPFKQNNQLWRNEKGIFKEVSNDQGSGFLKKYSSRGAIRVDLDNDGDLDIVVSNNNDRPQLYVNKVEEKNSWIGFILKNKENKPVTGSKVKLIHHDGTQLIKHVKSDGSYASANDPRIIFGLGKNNTFKTIEVTWPDGSKKVMKRLEINKYHEITN